MERSAPRRRVFERKAEHDALVDSEPFECEELARFAYGTWRDNPQPRCDWIALVKVGSCDQPEQTLVEKHSFHGRGTPAEDKKDPLQPPRDRVIDEAKKLRDMRGHGATTQPLFDAVDGLRVVETPVTHFTVEEFLRFSPFADFYRPLLLRFRQAGTLE